MDAPFPDRRAAGRQLAARLGRYAGHPGVVVLGLPRGGVPVAFEVAQALHAPLDVLVVRKLGVPGHEELAMGAIAAGGFQVLNREIVESLEIPPAVVADVTRHELHELERRQAAYRGDTPFPDLAGREVILVDDGLATGSTMKAAVAAARFREPAHVVVAVPTASPDTCDTFRDLADECVCLITPEPFQAVGLWYDDFSQTTDEEVREFLRLASQRQAGGE